MRAAICWQQANSWRGAHRGAKAEAETGRVDTVDIALLGNITKRVDKEDREALLGNITRSQRQEARSCTRGHGLPGATEQVMQAVLIITVQ